MSPTSRHRLNPRTSEAAADPDAIVWGAKAIGELIGRNERQAYHLLENGALRGARKIKGIWSAKRSALLSQWDEGRD
jgi:hypothetical protein